MYDPVTGDETDPLDPRLVKNLFAAPDQGINPTPSPNYLGGAGIGPLDILQRQNIPIQSVRSPRDYGSATDINDIRPLPWDTVTDTDTFQKAPKSDKVSQIGEYANRFKGWAMNQGMDPDVAEQKRKDFVQDQVSTHVGRYKYTAPLAEGLAEGVGVMATGAVESARRAVESGFNLPLGGEAGPYANELLGGKAEQQRATALYDPIYRATKKAFTEAEESVPGGPPSGVVQGVYDWTARQIGSAAPQLLTGAALGPSLSAGGIASEFALGNISEARERTDEEIRAGEKSGKYMTDDQKEDFRRSSEAKSLLAVPAQTLADQLLLKIGGKNPLLRYGGSIASGATAGAAQEAALELGSGKLEPGKIAAAGAGPAAVAGVLGAVPTAVSAFRNRSPAVSTHEETATPKQETSQQQEIPAVDPARYRSEAYGPSQGEYTHDTLNGPFGHLKDGDIAVSPNMIHRYPLGSIVDVVDDQGNVLRSNRRVADTSWKHPGEPNTDTIELWNDEDLGHAHLVLKERGAAGEKVSFKIRGEEVPQLHPEFNTKEASDRYYGLSAEDRAQYRRHLASIDPEYRARDEAYRKQQEPERVAGEEVPPPVRETAEEPGEAAPGGKLEWAPGELPRSSRAYTTPSLKQAAMVAAQETGSPIGKAIAALVPEDAALGIADLTKPISYGGNRFQAASGGGAVYHPDSRTALIDQHTQNIPLAILHEAMHSALHDLPLDQPVDSIQDPNLREAMGMIQNAYQMAREKAPAPNRQPDWMKYPLSSVKEFMSGAVADPRFQKWLVTNKTPAMGQIMQGIGKIAGMDVETPGNRAALYNDLGKVMNQATNASHSLTGMPVYAMNPVTKAANAVEILGPVGRFLRRAFYAMEVSKAPLMELTEGPHAIPEAEYVLKHMDQYYSDFDAGMGKWSSWYVPWKNKVMGAKAWDRVSNDVKDYLNHFDDPRNFPNKPLVHPLAQEWMDNFLGHRNDQAAEMVAGKRLVISRDGQTRLFAKGQLGGKIIVPRVERPDVRQMLNDGIMQDKYISPSNPNGYTPKFLEIYNESANLGYKKSPEELAKLMGNIPRGIKEGPGRSGLESARLEPLPWNLYDRSIEGSMARLINDEGNLIRVRHFDQTISPDGDRFTKLYDTLDKNHEHFSSYKIGLYRNAIESLKQEVYKQAPPNYDTEYWKDVGAVRSLTSGLLAGNWYTATKIAVSGTGSTFAYRNAANATKALASMIAHPVTAYRYARELGLLRDMLTYRNSPYYHPTLRDFVQKIGQGLIGAGAHNVVQDFTRMHNAITSRFWLSEAMSAIAKDRGLKNPFTKTKWETIERRGIDPDTLWDANGNVNPEAVNKWVASDVKDIQPSYRPYDYPGWTSNTTFGRIAFQFQHWAATNTRNITRELIFPMTDAIGRKDFGVAGVYLLNAIGALGIAAPVISEISRMAQTMIFGRQTGVATLGEIMQAWMEHPDGDIAMRLTMNRLINDYTGSALLGLLGDFVRVGTKLIQPSTADNPHFMNLTEPPMLSFGMSLASFLYQGYMQGGKVSNKQLTDFFQNNFSLVREAKGLVYTAGIPAPGYKEAMGIRDKQFVQGRVNLFYNEHPELDKRPLPGKLGMAFRPSPQLPVYQDLETAIYAGDTEEATRLVNTIPKDKASQLGLRKAILDRAPIPTGEAGWAFRDWFKGVGIGEEINRVSKTHDNYLRTAINAGALPGSYFDRHSWGAAPQQ